ncbi:MAG: hypothetical protein AAFX65_11160 [Cyanobacteria bacterium J06638_7]
MDAPPHGLDTAADPTAVGLTPGAIEGVIALHDQRRSYASFAAFEDDLPQLLSAARWLDHCAEVTRLLGLVEPLSAEHLPPETIRITAPSYRESLQANGLISRQRALLLVLEQAYGDLPALGELEVCLAEAGTGLAQWWRLRLGEERLVCRPAEPAPLPAERFDLLLCSDLLGAGEPLEGALASALAALRPQGRLVATCPLDFQRERAPAEARDGIPGWELLRQLRETGFSRGCIHHIASWKHGVLARSLPGVLVIEAQKGA